MALEKSDLKEIEKIVKATEKRLEFKIDQKVDQSKKEIISVLSREINDIAEINREFINRIDNHETRIVKLENKLKLGKV